jgi:hypothetical protein
MADEAGTAPEADGRQRRPLLQAGLISASPSAMLHVTEGGYFSTAKKPLSRRKPGSMLDTLELLRNGSRLSPGMRVNLARGTPAEARDLSRERSAG